MKKFLVCLALGMLSLGSALLAQTNVKLTAETDTLFFGDNKNSAVSRMLTFNYDAKMEAVFAQVSMDVHHINPLELPEIVVNGKKIPANIFFPSLKSTTKFYMFKVKENSDIVVNTPIGVDAAKLSFILSASDLIPGKNFIRLTVNNRDIENLDDFAITNVNIDYRSKSTADSYRDFTKQ